MDSSSTSIGQQSHHSNTRSTHIPSQPSRFSSSNGNNNNMNANPNINTNANYILLLQTVSELRLDLDKTINKMKGLEDQNSQLSRNYNTIKDELIETR